MTTKSVRCWRKFLQLILCDKSIDMELIIYQKNVNFVNMKKYHEKKWSEMKKLFDFK